MTKAKASIRDIRSLARAHTETAIKTLAGIMTQKKAPPAARVTAAGVLLDRGWGKAPQTVEGELTIKGIERIIIDVGKSDATD